MKLVAKQTRSHTETQQVTNQTEGHFVKILQKPFMKTAWISKGLEATQIEDQCKVCYNLYSLSLRFILNHQIQSHLAQLCPSHSFYILTHQLQYENNYGLISNKYIWEQADQCQPKGPKVNGNQICCLPKCKDEVHVRTFEPPNFGHLSQFEKPLLSQRSMFAMNQESAGELLRPKKLVNSSILSHCGEWIEWASRF